MRRAQRGVRGISLIEAVVALAVMAFGMLAYVGMQSTLRFNADVAKQRSEAVRIAQEAIERWRAYSAVEGVDEDETEYAQIVTTGAEVVAGETSNTTYNLVRTVVDAADTPAAPRMKTLVVDVTWTDRNNELQAVRLSTTIASSPPELAGALSLPGAGGPQRLPQGRHPGIPLPAKNLGDGTSGFKPPGAAGATVVWVFDNLTGVIVGVCNAVVTGQADLTAADVANCSNNTFAQPLSGFVRFATGVVQPTAADAENFSLENPANTALNLSIALDLTSLGHPIPDHVCYTAAPASAALAALTIVVPYYCAIFSNPARLWSGISTVTPLGFSDPDTAPWTIAPNAADVAQDHLRVCRYTPAASDAVVIPNWQHPRNYHNVSARELLANQNFLVIRAGNGGVPFQCPTDVEANPAAGDFVNSNTLLHQPAPAPP